MPVHPKNADDPMPVTLAGIVTDARFVHPAKNPSGTVVTPSANVTWETKPYVVGSNCRNGTSIQSRTMESSQTSAHPMRQAPTSTPSLRNTNAREWMPTFREDQTKAPAIDDSQSWFVTPLPTSFSRTVSHGSDENSGEYSKSTVSPTFRTTGFAVRSSGIAADVSEKNAPVARLNAADSPSATTAHKPTSKVMNRFIIEYPSFSKFISTVGQP